MPPTQEPKAGVAGATVDVEVAEVSRTSRRRLEQEQVVDAVDAGAVEARSRRGNRRC